MQSKIKYFTKIFFTSGSIYALMMVIFDYSQNENFNIFKTLLHFFGFGLIMAIIGISNFKQNKKEE